MWQRCARQFLAIATESEHSRLCQIGTLWVHAKPTWYWILGSSEVTVSSHRCAVGLACAKTASAGISNSTVISEFALSKLLGLNAADCVAFHSSSMWTCMFFSKPVASTCKHRRVHVAVMSSFRELRMVARMGAPAATGVGQLIIDRIVKSIGGHPGSDPVPAHFLRQLTLSIGVTSPVVIRDGPNDTGLWSAGATPRT